MFDRLLLLDKGGTTLYFGDIGHDGSTMIDYFVSNGAPECHTRHNPAEWMLEVTNNLFASESDTQQHKAELSPWSEKWDLSPQKQEVLRQLADLKLDLGQEMPSLLVSGDDSRDEYTTSLFEQLTIVSKRIFEDQWRDPAYLTCKIALSICLVRVFLPSHYITQTYGVQFCVANNVLQALVNGICFYNSPPDFQGVINLLFSIFLITQLFSCVDQLVIPHFINGRSLFEAPERNSKTYSWVVFVATNILVELLWQTIIAVPIFVAWYYPTGLARNGNWSFSTAERGAMSFMLIWLFNLWASTISQGFTAAFERPGMAMHVATLFYWLSLVFCGYVLS